MQRDQRQGKKSLPINTPKPRDGIGGLARDAHVDVLASLGDHLYELTQELSESELAALYLLLDSSASLDAWEALNRVPASEILDPDELLVFQRLSAESPPSFAGLRPSMVMIMKTTRLCNLRCSYCYQWRQGPNQIMSFEVLARAIRDVLCAPDVSRVEFVWHGGEATLLSTDLYRKALWLQQKFRRSNQRIENSMQTNAVRMTDEWIQFWRTYQFSIGVSLDGPPQINDARRLDVAGRPTSERILKNLERLRFAGISHGVLMVVDEDVVSLGAQALLDYLVQADVRQIDLLNVLPANAEGESSSGDAYIALSRYVAFLSDVFAVWWPGYANKVTIRELSGLLGQLSGGAAHTCIFAGNCFGGFLTIDPSGAVSACDKYDSNSGYLFGSLKEQNLSDIGRAARLKHVRKENAKSVGLMQECPWFDVCRGACPHDRYTSTRRGASDHDSGCCGTSVLFERISEALAAAGWPLQPVAQAWVSRKQSAASVPVVTVADK